MLAQRRKRWANIESTLGKRFVAGRCEQHVADDGECVCVGGGGGGGVSADRGYYRSLLGLESHFITQSVVTHDVTSVIMIRHDMASQVTGASCKPS